MPRRIFKAAAVVLAAFLIVSQFALATPFALADSVDAEGSASAASGSSRGYGAYLVDDADIFTDDEESQIRSEMERFGDICNIAVASGEGSGMPTAKSYFAKYIGSGNSGTILFFDMKARKISVYSEGEAYRFVTDSRGTEITDNVYRDASKGDYAKCAMEALDEIYSTLHGEMIFAPMRYVNNAFICVSLAAIIMFLFVRGSRGKVSNIDSDDAVRNYLDQTSNVRFSHLASKLISQTSRDSDGGGGGSGGGGGGGGGGSHGF